MGGFSGGHGSSRRLWIAEGGLEGGARWISEPAKIHRWIMDQSLTGTRGNPDALFVVLDEGNIFVTELDRWLILRLKQTEMGENWQLLSRLDVPNAT